MSSSTGFAVIASNRIASSDRGPASNSYRAIGALRVNADVDAWLEEIGLSQYAETFRSNAIDGNLLYGLTNDDLREMGVMALGHRKRLLDAITALRATADGGLVASGPVEQSSGHSFANRHRDWLPGSRRSWAPAVRRARAARDQLVMRQCDKC